MSTNSDLQGAAAQGFPCIPGIPTVEGVGELLKVTRQHVEECFRPELVDIVDPADGTRAIVVVDREGVCSLDPSYFDAYRVNPLFRSGTAVMTSLDSFIAHVLRFGDADTVVFADDRPTQARLTAVLDYHRKDQDEGAHGEYRHGRHRTEFAFPLSEEWEAWSGMNGKPMSMVEFARFLEDRIDDIALPEDGVPESLERFVATHGGADSIASYGRLIELSRGLKIHESAVIEEAQTLASGEGHVRFSVDHTARNGAGDTVRVPTMFFIAIPVFRNGAFYRIGARLRYRKEQALKFWFDLQRPDRSFEHAFAEAVERVRAETQAQTFLGAPE